MSQKVSIYTDAFIKRDLHKHKKEMTQLADKSCRQNLGNRWQMSFDMFYNWKKASTQEKIFYCRSDSCAIIVVAEQLKKPIFL